MKKFFKQNNKAFTLVETLVAISIFTMSILGLISILASGISNTGYAKNKMTASYLAQEGIEYVRNIRDTDVISAVDGQTGWSKFFLDKDNISYPVTDPDFAGFTRKIQINSVGPSVDEVQISSTVSWTQNSGDFSITFTENLFNWVE